jgi:endonuclease/exonuclease/phosphatase family metal-dependent hydrolase
MKIRFGWLSLLAALTTFTACAAAPEGSGPADDDFVDDDTSFVVGKADGSCLPSVTSDDARGVLALANDATVDAAALHAIGISTKAADGIVAGRPFADLTALDAVPNVGPFTCRALRTDACNVRGLCERELPLWTWNIEHFPLSGSAIGQVASTLNKEPVEIVGFEEVDSLPAFDQLLGQLPGWEGVHGANGFETQVALAYRADRLHPTAVENLFEGDSYRFPRPPLAITFEVQGRVGVSELTVIVVHLKAMVDADSQERRRQALITLEQWMYQKRKSGNGVMIAVGDYNDDIDDEPANNVFQPFLTRPQSYAALTLPVAQRGEFSYIPFHRLIDHMIATHEAAEKFPAVAVEAVTLDQTIPNYVKSVSDHRPVRSRLIPIIPAP